MDVPAHSHEEAVCHLVQVRIIVRRDREAAARWAAKGCAHRLSSKQGLHRIAAAAHLCLRQQFAALRERKTGLRGLLRSPQFVLLLPQVRHRLTRPNTLRRYPNSSAVLAKEFLEVRHVEGLRVNGCEISGQRKATLDGHGDRKSL